MNRPLLYAFAMLLLLSPLSFSQVAYIVNPLGSTWNATASFTQKVYVDVLPDPSVNPDFAIKICDVGQKYVAAVYAMNSTGTATYMTISKDLTSGSNATLVRASNAAGGTCYMTPADKFAFSQFRDFTRAPIIYVSAFPGRPHILYSDNIDGSSPSFSFLNYQNGTIRGSFSLSASYNDASNNVTGSIGSITFQTDAGPQTKSPADADWGINNTTGRALVVGLCSDDYGGNCSDAKIITDPAQLPVQLALHAATSDQVVYTRYFVVNGLSTSLCIGANIVPSIVFVPPSPIDSGQSSVATVTLTNNGNVPITTDFNLTLNITGPNGYVNTTNWIITENISVGGSTTRAVTFTNSSRSGTYVFTAHADRNNNLVECDENNIASQNLVVNKLYTLRTFIDNVENDTFPHAGRAYNVTVYVSDSDGNIVNDTNFVFTETNGLNPFTPVQIWNNSGALFVIRSTITGTVSSNSSSLGNVSLVMVPTCNTIYSNPVNGTHINSSVGSYSLTIRGYGAGFDITKTMNVTNKTCDYPGGFVNDKEILNKYYVGFVYDRLYEAFSVLKKLLAP